MFKIIALFGLVIALLVVAYVAMQFADASAAIARQENARQPDLPPASNLTTMPAHRVLARCLNDVDDYLDTIQDPTSFAKLRPHILGRVRRHVAEMRAYADSGTTLLNKAASQELKKAADRHSQSLARAVRAVPAVREFFNTEVAAALDGKK